MRGLKKQVYTIGRELGAFTSDDIISGLNYPNKQKKLLRIEVLRALSSLVNEGLFKVLPVRANRLKLFFVPENPDVVRERLNALILREYQKYAVGYSYNKVLITAAFILFLFKEKPYWTLNELMAKTRKPRSLIRTYKSELISALNILLSSGYIFESKDVYVRWDSQISIDGFTVSGTYAEPMYDFVYVDSVDDLKTHIKSGAKLILSNNPDVVSVLNKLGKKVCMWLVD